MADARGMSRLFSDPDAAADTTAVKIQSPGLLRSES